MTEAFKAHVGLAPRNAVDERARKRQKLSEALALVPHRTFEKIRKLLQSDELSDKDRRDDARGHGKKAAQAALKPFMMCYAPVDVPSCREAPIRVYMGSIEKILMEVMARSAVFAQRFGMGLVKVRSCSMRFIPMKPRVEKCSPRRFQQKMHLAHVHVLGVLDPLREESWVPLAAVPNRDVAKMKSGFSGLMKTLMLCLDRQRMSGVRLGDRHFRLSMQCFLGDYDAVCRAFGSKSASGLKPCIKC